MRMSGASRRWRAVGSDRGHSDTEPAVPGGHRYQGLAETVNFFPLQEIVVVRPDPYLLLRSSAQLNEKMVGVDTSDRFRSNDCDGAGETVEQESWQRPCVRERLRV